MKRTATVIKLIIVCGALVLLVFACGRRKPTANRNEPQAMPAAPATSASPIASATPQQVEGIISPAESNLVSDLKFNHNRPEHKRQDCSICHQRTDNSATPRFPGHSACLTCHTADYTTPNSKLCQVCHEVPLERPTPKAALFPARLIQFGVKEFSHKQHLDPARMASGMAVPGCETCHQFDTRLIQASFPAHPQCYSCHTHQPGEKLAGCGGCHADQSVALKFNKGTGNALALYNFTHGGHFKQGSVQRKCDKCHHLLDRDPRHPDILQITTARGQRHTSGCWSCHVQAREPDCSKCHVKGPPV